MFFYPWPKLIADAEGGDLFVYHLIKEAQAIFDPSDRLGRLRSVFRPCRSYEREIAQASEVGWLIDRHADELARGAVARRMLWCVRTILIARSAERGEPLFAPAALAASTSSMEAAELLTGRHQRKVDAVARRRFRRFLSGEANQSILASNASLIDYERLFERSGNAIGLRTLRAKRESDGTYV